jgi:RNA polymerase sigma-70 factor (ECF subfamily)
MRTTAELVRASQAGEKCAFAELVRRYERSAMATAYTAIGDFHMAQDAAQDGFVVAYQRLDGLRDPDAFGPWLLKIVRRRANELGKKAAGLPTTPTNDLVASDAMKDWIAQFDEVVQQVDRLPEHERDVVMLRYFDGHSVIDVARLTARPVGTVTKQISRALERLRTWLVEISP